MSLQSSAQMVSNDLQPFLFSLLTSSLRRKWLQEGLSLGHTYPPPPPRHRGSCIFLSYSVQHDSEIIMTNVSVTLCTIVVSKVNKTYLKRSTPFGVAWQQSLGLQIVIFTQFRVTFLELNCGPELLHFLQFARHYVISTKWQFMGFKYF